MVGDIEKDGKVTVRNAKVNAATFMDFISNTHLYYTGIQGGVTEVLKHHDDTSLINRVKGEVKKLCARFPLYTQRRESLGLL